MIMAKQLSYKAFPIASTGSSDSAVSKGSYPTSLTSLRSLSPAMLRQRAATYSWPCTSGGTPSIGIQTPCPSGGSVGSNMIFQPEGPRVSVALSATSNSSERSQRCLVASPGSHSGPSSPPSTGSSLGCATSPPMSSLLVPLFSNAASQSSLFLDSIPRISVGSETAGSRESNKKEASICSLTKARTDSNISNHYFGNSENGFWEESNCKDCEEIKDPWEGFEDIAENDLIAWFADFARQRKDSCEPSLVLQAQSNEDENQLLSLVSTLTSSSSTSSKGRLCMQAPPQLPVSQLRGWGTPSSTPSNSITPGECRPGDDTQSSLGSTQTDEKVSIRFKGWG